MFFPSSPPVGWPSATVCLMAHLKKKKKLNCVLLFLAFSDSQALQQYIENILIPLAHVATEKGQYIIYIIFLVLCLLKFWIISNLNWFLQLFRNLTKVPSVRNGGCALTPICCVYTFTVVPSLDVSGVHTLNLWLGHQPNSYLDSFYFWRDIQSEDLNIKAVPKPINCTLKLSTVISRL